MTNRKLKFAESAKRNAKMISSFWDSAGGLRERTCDRPTESFVVPKVYGDVWFTTSFHAGYDGTDGQRSAWRG